MDLRSESVEKLIELSPEQLESGIAEFDSRIKDLKYRIVSEYEIIKPVLTRMRDMKRELHTLKDRRETYKTFLSIDRNGTLNSISSLDSLKAEMPLAEMQIPRSENPVTLRDIIQEIDGGKLDDSNSEPKTPRTPRADKTDSRKIPLEWLMPKRTDSKDATSRTLPRMKSPKTPTKGRDTQSSIPVLKRK